MLLLIMIGHVVKNQIPIFLSFDEEHVEYVCEHLAEAMERAYLVYEFFREREDYDD